MLHFYVTTVVGGGFGFQVDRDHYLIGSSVRDAIDYYMVERNAVEHPDGEVWWSSATVQLVAIDVEDVDGYVDDGGHFDVWSAVGDGVATVVHAVTVSGTEARAWQGSVAS